MAKDAEYSILTNSAKSMENRTHTVCIYYICTTASNTDRVKNQNMHVALIMVSFYVNVHAYVSV